MASNFWYPDSNFDPYTTIYPAKYFAFGILLLILLWNSINTYKEFIKEFKRVTKYFINYYFKSFWERMKNC